jgi:alpha-D-ribose 1-methylphosphonate 5-triphosphate diphosphatase
VNRDFTLKGGRLVLPNEVVRGTLAVAGGCIVAIDGGTTSTSSATDVEGDFLIPGLVELHTDNFERHLMPRPKVRWPDLAALLAHDAEVIGTGITTVYDALGVGDTDVDALRGQSWSDVIACIDASARQGILRADHRLHARCELPAANVEELFEPFAEHPLLGLISLMDHTPGQRQWENIDHARVFYTGKKQWTLEKFERQVRHQKFLQERHAVPHRAHFVDFARQRGLALASHDDTTIEHVRNARDEGVTICEFPTTAAAAQTARELGMAVIMGAPNAVRGGSHSGNVATLELARAGLVDTLSSDYVPSSLLMAPFLLVEHAGFSVPQAIATVTINPARCAGLRDRGELAPGMRADLVQVRMVERREGGQQPVVRAVWRGGERVL